MAKVTTKKWRRTPPAKVYEKPPKYQAATRVKFRPIEVLTESEYAYETKQ